jgi:hypothetical protein
MRCPRCNSQTVSLVPATSKLFCATCGRWNDLPVQERMWLETPSKPAVPVTDADTARTA